MHFLTFIQTSPLHHFIISSLLRYWVITTASPGMATKDATNGKVEPTNGAMFAYRFNGILTTSGRKTARRRGERRNKPLIESNRCNEKLRNQVHSIKSSAIRCNSSVTFDSTIWNSLHSSLIQIKAISRHCPSAKALSNTSLFNL